MAKVIILMIGHATLVTEKVIDFAIHIPYSTATPSVSSNLADSSTAGKQLGS